MLNLVVCIKQVPRVSELPWDPGTGLLKRETADGMMNPACRHALEAALRLREEAGGNITAVTMGPPMAEEILREAAALGADRGILLSDPVMAGADTLVTSRTLAAAIRKECPDFHLILCGCQTSDSETAQVGPQLAEELDIPGAAYAEELEISGSMLRMRRETDDFLETLEMDLPGLVTVTTRRYPPRYTPMGGIQNAFDGAVIDIRKASDLGISPELVGMGASPTQIVEVYSPVAEKKNILMKGAVKRSVERLLEEFGDKISSAMSKDLKSAEEDGDA